METYIPSSSVYSMKYFLEKTIREASTIALKFFDQLDTLKVNNKGAKDLVSEADITVENFLRDKLLKKHPDFGFWGEESEQIAGKTRWVVDPIDGTHSFVRGQYFWSISIALEVEGDIQLAAVFAPALNDLYIASKGEGAWKNDKQISVSKIDQLKHAMVATGFACLRDNLEENNLARFSRIALKTMDQRRYGSAALDVCLVADGSFDAFWEQNLNLYDIAAGSLIAMEAGASVTDFKGRPGIFPKEVLITNRKVLAEIIELM